MARRRAPIAASTEAVVRQVLETLGEEAYSPEAERAMARRLAGFSDAEVARELVLGYLASFPGTPDLFDVDELSRFAGFLTFVAGSAAAGGAILGAKGQGGRLLRRLACGIVEPEGDFVDPLMLAALLDGPDSQVWEALAWVHASGQAGELLPRVLEAGAGKKKTALLAGWALSFPLPARARQAAIAAGGEGMRDRPAIWPAVGAYATMPDGYGAQALYIVRRRGPRSFALGGIFLSEWRGVADAVGNPRVSTLELERSLAEMREGPAGLYVVPVGYLMARFREGLAIAGARGIPLPFEVQAQEYLFDGLWSEPAAGPHSGAPGADPCGLLSHPSLESWFLTREDGPEVEAFLQAAARAAHDAPNAAALEGDLDRVVDEHAEPAVGARRRTLAARLDQVAYLLDLAGERVFRDRALGAANALDSQGPLWRQAFVRELLHRSFAESEFGWLID